MLHRSIHWLLGIMLLIPAYATADYCDFDCCEDPCCYPSKFYLKIGSGASFAVRATVNASPAIWDPSPNGYNSSLGTAPILLGGIGYDYCSLFSGEFSVSYRPQFEYNKFQTSQPSSTPGFLGNTKTRRFKLDVSSAMFSAYFSGRTFDYSCWQPPCIGGHLFPVIGAGVGVSRLNIFDFRTTGLPSVLPDVNPAPGFGSDNAYTVRYRFTYQVSAGVEYNYCDTWSLSVGYRWFDAGRLNGPQYIRRPPGTALDITGNEWKMRFRANELLVEFKLFL